MQELQEWHAHFLLEDYAADYRAAIAVWAQTDGKLSPFEVLTQLFPQYSAQAVETVDKPAPVEDDVYEWTWDDRKVFDRIIASLPQE